MIFLNLYSDDQINFDVSEIEILDDGKKIVGKNRSIITTDNGIIIQADEFEFDKVIKTGSKVAIKISEKI